MCEFTSFSFPIVLHSKVSLSFAILTFILLYLQNPVGFLLCRYTSFWFTFSVWRSNSFNAKRSLIRMKNEKHFFDSLSMITLLVLNFLSLSNIRMSVKSFRYTIYESEMNRKWAIKLIRKTTCGCEFIFEFYHYIEAWGKRCAG